MSSAKLIGNRPCPACEFDRARVSLGKNETLSILCPECGTLSMVKSPKAVDALKKKLGITPASSPAPTAAAPAKDGGFGTWLNGK